MESEDDIDQPSYGDLWKQALDVSETLAEEGHDDDVHVHHDMPWEEPTSSEEEEDDYENHEE